MNWALCLCAGIFSLFTTAIRLTRESRHDGFLPSHGFTTTTPQKETLQNLVESKRLLSNKIETNIPIVEATNIWEPVSGDHVLRSGLKVPLPIFVASPPKSATTMTARYFRCGGIRTGLTKINPEESANSTLANETTVERPKSMKLGQCYHENVLNGRPPFENCGRNDVFIDGGWPTGTPCFHPSVHGLDDFYQAYPNATIMLVTRNVTRWSELYLKWYKGTGIWKRCDKFPDSADGLPAYYEWHLDNVRNFAHNHPTLTFVEVSLEDERIGEHLKQQVGLSSSCFRRVEPKES